MDLRGTAIHKPAGLQMKTLVVKYIKVRQRRGFESKTELQKTVFKRQFGLAFKAHKKLQNVYYGAVGQKGRRPFFLNIFKKKHTSPLWPTKQAGKGNQHYKEVSLPIGQKGHPEKVEKPEMQDGPWRKGSLVTLMGGM